MSFEYTSIELSLSDLDYRIRRIHPFGTAPLGTPVRARFGKSRTRSSSEPCVRLVMFQFQQMDQDIALSLEVGLLPGLVLFHLGLN